MFGYIKNNIYLCNVKLKIILDMKFKIIGYQIVKYCQDSRRFDDVPDDLYSFVIFRYYYNVMLYFNSLKHKSLYTINPIYEGDIEEPTFYEDIYPSVITDRVERIKMYLSSLPNMKVSYINENQGQVYFSGVVRDGFLTAFKDSINATDAYITFLPAMIAPGIVIVFHFNSIS